jgi:CMP-N-acetylneuraminic acid synthetase
MIDDTPVFCFILARGGSKGLPRKNILEIDGIPLVGRSINSALDVNYIDEVYVSTDDFEIKKKSLSCGAKVIDRPKDLATDTSHYLDALKHMTNQICYENQESIIVILEATFPIRSSQNIQKCIELKKFNIDVVTSISKVKLHPSYMVKSTNENILSFYLDSPPNPNRQQREQLYALNGSITVTNAKFLLNQKDSMYGGQMKGFLIDEESSMDIDSNFDYQISKLYVENLTEKN